jgi:ribosomal protein S1
MSDSDDSEMNVTQNLYGSFWPADELIIGQTFLAKVVSIHEDGLLVDFGYAVEGIVPLSQLTDDEFESISPGDILGVEVIDTEDSNGDVILSHQRYKQTKIFESILKRGGRGSTLTGSIIERVPSGYIVDVGLRAFLPNSEVGPQGLHLVETLPSNELQFEVKDFEEFNREIVVSLSQIQQRDLDQRLQLLQVGEIVQCVITYINQDFILVDAKGVLGMVHLSEMDWKPLLHPAEDVEIGDVIAAEIIGMDNSYNLSSSESFLSRLESDEEGSHLSKAGIEKREYHDESSAEEAIERLKRRPCSVLRSYLCRQCKKWHIGNTTIAPLELSIRRTLPHPNFLFVKKSFIGQIVVGRVHNLTKTFVEVDLGDGVEGYVLRPSNALRRWNLGEDLFFEIVDLEVRDGSIVLVPRSREEARDWYFQFADIQTFEQLLESIEINEWNET